MEAFQEFEQDHRLAKRVCLLASAVKALRLGTAPGTVDLLVGLKWMRVYGDFDDVLYKIEVMRENLEYEWEWEAAEDELEPRPGKGDTSGE